LRLSVAALLACLIFTGTAQAQGFVPGFEDVPLMFELDADDEPMIFDTPSGRIVEASARGSSSPLRVISFYRETLPQFGWRTTPGAEGIYVRDGELLRLSVFEAPGNEVEVRFSLTPAPGRL